MVRCWLVKRVLVRLGGGGLVTVFSSLAEFVKGSVLAAWGRPCVCGGSLLFFTGVLIFVSGFWLGSISPYSSELGFGEVVVIWMWCLFPGQIGLFLVYSYCQFADEHYLHVVWYVWVTVPSRVLVFMAVVEGVLSKFSGLSVICSLWKEAIGWLEFELFKLMVSVTVSGVRPYVPPVVSLPMV